MQHLSNIIFYSGISLNVATCFWKLQDEYRICHDKFLWCINTELTKWTFLLTLWLSWPPQTCIWKSLLVPSDCFHTKLYSNLRIGEVVICTETVLSTAQNPASDLTYFSLYTRGRLMNGVNTFLPNTNPHIGCIHLQWQKVSHITNNSAQV